MILVLDNYDSFTFNLVQCLGALGARVEVRRNDAVSVADVTAMSPDGIVISPGPKTPSESGICRGVIAALAGRVPVLGVCLGHQCIGEVYGGTVVRAERLMHGKTSDVIHSGHGIFAGLDNPFVATRYHSLIVRRDTIDEDVLEIVAWTSQGEVMGLKHREHDTWGVQFHPESILTTQGTSLLQNFLSRCPG